MASEKRRRWVGMAALRLHWRRKSAEAVPIPTSGQDDRGSRAAEDERRSKSSLDIRQSGTTESPPTSRRRRLWNSLKRRTSKLRTRSKEKGPISKRDEAGGEDGEAVTAAGCCSDGGTHGDRASDFDSLFKDAEKRRQRELLERTRGEEKESEVDSGIGVIVSSEAGVLRQRQRNLKSHPFFILDVVLREGKDLVVRDSCGTSDPYVKFKIGGKQHYKSRIVYKNLNPKWEEKFSLPIEDPFKPVEVRVYDYDRGLNDDPMGGAEIDPSGLEPDVPTELKLDLSEKEKKKGKPESMGHLVVSCTLVPKSLDEKEQYFKRMTKIGGGDTAKKLKTQIWSSVVTIVLIEGKKLLPMDDNGLSDPYVKFRLGQDRYKSKRCTMKVKNKTLNPRWLEQFDMHMFDDQTSHLEISVWDHDIGGKDDVMGRTTIDLSSLEPETTHKLDQPLEDGAGILKMLLTVSGTSGNETVSDLANYTADPEERSKIVRKYGLLKSFKGIKDVGWLQVKAIKAQNLAAADIGGKSDPFCVLELVNSRLQTHTEYKTLSPEWGKIFTFNVNDIHANLDITVYDEDRDKKVEFLGKVSIPLLKIKNGERRWYSLKDRKLMRRAKGGILLEMDFIMNHFKSAIRTFNPREEKYMQPDSKFKLSVMKRNIDRVSKIAASAVESGKFLQSCFEWESKPRSLTAFLVFLIIVWNFELYMLPVTLLIVFLKNLLVVQIVGNLMKDKDESEYVDEEDDDDDDVSEAKDKNKKGAKEEKKSFKEKLQAIQDVCLQVQEGMDMAASMGERVKNTFNWTVPWLSWLAVIVLTIASVILYNVPIRYIIMLWGINKFTKKLRAPNAIPNNEVLDYLSRVPSDKELFQYRELRPEPAVGSQKKKRA